MEVLSEQPEQEAIVECECAHIIAKGAEDQILLRHDYQNCDSARRGARVGERDDIAKWHQWPTEPQRRNIDCLHVVRHRLHAFDGFVRQHALSGWRKTAVKMGPSKGKQVAYAADRRGSGRRPGVRQHEHVGTPCTASCRIRKVPDGRVPKDGILGGSTGVVHANGCEHVVREEVVVSQCQGFIKGPGGELGWLLPSREALDQQESIRSACAGVDFGMSQTSYW